ncbi:DUF262 domain-containing protein [Paenarthrobacter sp. A20]|uniref:DUF262 domain-containing protein n=1 Tax=Paenarthrobacter sp. A20 TaxID=2817891 RepID=UPI0020A177E7|nr:DUF262 domain-containing protein [Paenarthrobacter sp. A20]MCP1410831.1 hypothetical protein [Paenarthrobacter sp. A20]
MSGRFATTTKDIGLLKQLYDDGQLQISAEFQRNAIWPRPAKSFLIDTILTDNPIPVLYFQKGISAQTKRVEYTVVDGQQRLNAVFQFLENRFALTESDPSSPWYRQRWKSLDEEHRLQILSYDFVIQELVGYSSNHIRDMFKRMNRYVVALNPQELRHATEDGAFKRLVESIGKWPFWTENGVVTRQAANRMKNDELVAELLILLSEGPQDKKESVDLYYDSFRQDFPQGPELQTQLASVLEEIQAALPNLKKSLLRRPANIYALIGAMNELQAEEEQLPPTAILGQRISDFNEELAASEDERTPRASRYFVAQSRQTDNIRPRRARIDELKRVILNRG